MGCPERATTRSEHSMVPFEQTGLHHTSTWHCTTSSRSNSAKGDAAAAPSLSHARLPQMLVTFFLTILVTILAVVAALIYQKLKARREARRYISQHHTIAALRVVGPAAPAWATAGGPASPRFATPVPEAVQPSPVPMPSLGASPVVIAHHKSLLALNRL